MRQTSCQYGGILPIGAGSILLILWYGLLLTLNLFAMLQLLQNLTTWSSSYVHLYSAQRKSGRPREEKRIKGAIEIAIDKMEKKKKMVETWKKREPIEPDDLVEYRNIKKKCKKDDKTLGEAMGKTVAKGAKGKEKAGKGKATKGKGGKQKSGYKKRVTQSTTTSPKMKKARRGK